MPHIASMTVASSSAISLKRTHRVYITVLLFSVIVVSDLIGVSLFSFVYGYSWFDWTMFGIFYTLSGLGITAGTTG